MSYSEEEALEIFQEVPAFVANQEGELRKNEDNRYRDFIIGRKVGDEEDDLTEQYSFGEVHLPPESLDELHKLVYGRVYEELREIQSNEKEMVRYGEEQADRDYVKYITSNDLPLIDEFEDIFNETTLPATNYHDTPTPAFQATRILDSNDEMVIGFQYYWNNQLLGNTSLFNLWYQDHEPVPLDEPIISIPNRLDAVYHNDVLYIFNDWQFEQMFDYDIYYEEVANDVLDTIEGSDIEFVNESVVESAIDNIPNMMRKFEDIKNAEIYQEIGMDDIEWVINEYDLDGIGIDKSNGSKAVRIQNQMKVWNLLHILNDDHVESRLSERAYQASNKTELDN